MSYSILVTGGSGFIGTNLIELLVNINSFRILNYDKNPPVKESHNSFWVKGDIMDEKKMFDTFISFKPDIVIHLAARTDTLSEKLVDYEDNHLGTLHLLNVINKSPWLRHVIVTSTQYVYKSEEKPIPTEIDEYKPHTTYGKSKVLTEQYTYDANLACMWTIVRPTNIWGPWHMRYPNELWKVLDRGIYFHPVKHEVIRTYGYVKNVAHQIFQIISSPKELVDQKMYYVGDAPIDSYTWLNEISLQMTNREVKRLPKFIFQGAALGGDILRSAYISFPLYSDRFKNMIEDYPAPTNLTLKLFGQANPDLKSNVSETLTWLKGEGSVYFDYWKNK